MAITPNTFKNLTFGGINSADYGVYISGEGVYNAPSRAVELTQIPGRNGAIPVDMGYWENIEIVYPCGMFGSDQTDFAQNYSDFINAIASQKGYQRLEDTYHPDEFRQALFVSGVETKPIGFGQAGEFELVFNCKPQRFLTSGETYVTVTSGNDISNPTRLEAKPLLAIKGTGEVDIGDKRVFLDDVEVGDIYIPAKSGRADYELSLTPYKIANGDTISLDNVYMMYKYTFNSTVTSASVTSWSGTAGCNASVSFADNYIWITVNLPYNTPSTYTYGTMGSYGGLASVNVNGSIEQYAVGFSYNGGDIISFDKGKRMSDDAKPDIATFSFNGGVIHSTAPMVGNPTYIDCELGDAYEIRNDELILLNQLIAIDADLPTLPSGNTTITYDNTITEVKIKPNWWIL